MPETVLHIDDEPALGAAVRVRLVAAGFEVIGARDGESGLAKAMDARPDVILLDVRMPGMDGYEVCRRLKADPTLAPIPVIFVTANTADEAHHRARAAGGFKLISKPYRAPDIIAALHAALDSVRPRGAGTG